MLGARAGVSDQGAISNNPGRDSPQEEGLYEIQPAAAALPSVRRPPVPVARDSDPNYSRGEKERRLMEAKQTLGAFS